MFDRLASVPSRRPPGRRAGPFGSRARKDSRARSAGTTHFGVDRRYLVSCYRPREHDGADLTMAEQKLTERGMAVGLRALNRLASNPLIDRFGLRDPAQRVLHRASKATVRTATRAGRTFAATQKLSKPARQPRSGRSDLFDLTPDDEQQMLRESVRDFALAKLRPAALAADEACATPDELLAQANELGLTMVGVPEELG